MGGTEVPPPATSRYLSAYSLKIVNGVDPHRRFGPSMIQFPHIGISGRLALAARGYVR
jgi:hypothetical protein